MLPYCAYALCIFLNPNLIAGACNPRGGRTIYLDSLRGGVSRAPRHCRRSLSRYIFFGFGH